MGPVEDSERIDFYIETIKKPLKGFNQKKNLIQSAFLNANLSAVLK